MVDGFDVIRESDYVAGEDEEQTNYAQYTDDVKSNEGIFEECQVRIYCEQKVVRTTYMHEEEALQLEFNGLSCYCVVRFQLERAVRYNCLRRDR